MNTQRKTGGQEDAGKREPNKVQPRTEAGSEAVRKGGKESAQRQAERDWEESSKESGE